MSLLAGLPLPLLLAGIAVITVVGYLFVRGLRRFGGVILTIAAVLLILFLLGGAR